MLRDDSILPDDASPRRDEKARRSRVSEWLKNMKVELDYDRLTKVVIEAKKVLPSPVS
jgi:hypothetical protein